MSGTMLRAAKLTLPSRTVKPRKIVARKDSSAPSDQDSWKTGLTTRERLQEQGL